LTGPEKQAVVLTLIQVLKDDDAEIRLQAARALEAAGPEAKAAVPALIKLLEETSPVAKAGMGKGTMKKAPIVPIQQAKGTGGFDDIDDQFGPGGGFGQGMTKKGKGGGFGQPGGGFGGGGPGRPVDEFRRQIVRTLGSIGPEATEAFPVFLVLVKSPYEEYGVRDEAVAALGKMGPAAKECIPVLIGICDRSRPGFERPLLDSAVIALENMGPAAKDAVPVLLRVLNDTQIVAIQGRIQVARALGNIGPAAKEAVPALLEIQSAQYSPQQQLETRAQWLQFQAAAATALKKIQQ